MHVQEHSKVAVLVRAKFASQALSQHFDLILARLVIIRVSVRKKVSVHVLSLQSGAIVAGHDAVGVDHRYEPNFKLLSEKHRQIGFCEEEVQEAMDDKGGVSLARVLPPNHHNHWLPCILIFPLRVVL